VDLAWLGEIASRRGGSGELAARIVASNTAMEAFGHAEAAGVDLPSGVAEAARRTADSVLGEGTRLDVVIFDRAGRLLARAGDH